MSQKARKPLQSIYIDTTKQNPVLVRAAIDHLKSIGVSIYEGTLDKPVDSTYPFVYWNGRLLDQVRSKQAGTECTDLGEFMNYFEPISSIEVKLNNSYTAIVTKEEVIVGCQTFTHDKIEKIYNAIKSFKK